MKGERTFEVDFSDSKSVTSKRLLVWGKTLSSRDFDFLLQPQLEVGLSTLLFDTRSFAIYLFRPLFFFLFVIVYHIYFNHDSPLKRNISFSFLL